VSSFARDGRILVKGYATGKVVLVAEGDPRYAEQAAAVCEGCLRVEPIVDRGLFAQTLRERGVPEDAISGYLRSLQISDDSTHFREGPIRL
jgi:hypothetical protein